jgi:hypothetical protein
MRLEFMAWNEKFTKKMEEHMRIIESFSPLCSALVSQSSPITPQPAATVTKNRKKRVAKATKIHQCRCQTKSSSTSNRAAHLISVKYCIFNPLQLMFVNLLPLLISNVLVSFGVLVFCRLLSCIWG